MIKYLWNLTDGFRGRIVFSTSAGIIRVVTGLIFVALSKRTVDIATGDANGNLALFVAGLVTCIAIELICAATANRITEMSEAEMKNRLQKNLFSPTLWLPNGPVRKKCIQEKCCRALRKTVA